MVAAFSGCAYINGSTGPEGPRGEQGIQGEKGDTGETPVITVAEDTPLSYKLHFQTSEQELTTPNLFAPFTEYHVDLSAADSTLNIPLKDLILTYQRASASALRISIAPKNTAAPVLVDLRRTTIYDGSTIETQTFNGSSISASIAIDGTVYTNSQETHNMRIRQQDPVTKLWSMCEINSFLSAADSTLLHPHPVERVRRGLRRVDGVTTPIPYKDTVRVPERYPKRGRYLLFYPDRFSVIHALQALAVSDVVGVKVPFRARVGLQNCHNDAAVDDESHARAVRHIFDCLRKRLAATRFEVRYALPVWDGRQAHRIDPRLIGGVARELVGGLPLKAAKICLNQAVHDGIRHLREQQLCRLPRA